MAATLSGGIAGVPASQRSSASRNMGCRPWTRTSTRPWNTWTDRKRSDRTSTSNAVPCTSTSASAVMMRNRSPAWSGLTLTSILPSRSRTTSSGNVLCVYTAALRAMVSPRQADVGGIAVGVRLPMNNRTDAAATATVGSHQKRWMKLGVATGRAAAATSAARACSRPASESEAVGGRLLARWRKRSRDSHSERQRAHPSR